MSGLSDEAVREGHDLIDGAEHEAKANPKAFNKVHPVGEKGGSILPESGAASSSADKPAAAANQQSPGEFLDAKLNELKQTQAGEFLESKLNELKDKFETKK